MGEAAEDLWHVRLGPDEVKQLSLEQLDDLFRLDVISADTQVWQPGMDEWLPLSVVAGLGDDEPETMSIPVSEPPPPTTLKRPVGATTQLGWPPPPVVANSWPPPASRSTAVTTRPPPPPSSRSHAPPSSALSSWPPAAAWSDPPARVAVSGLAPTLAASTPFSAPLAPSLGVFEDTAPRARRGGSGAWVVVLSVLVGVAVTLYRNDVVHAAASSMGQSATFLKLETALGGPGFGTPRAVEQMMTRPKLEAEPLATTSVATSTPVATTTPAPVPSPQAEAPKPSTPEPPKPAAAPAPAKAAAASAPRTASASPAARSGGGSGVTDPDNVFKQPKKGKKVKGSDYDPLNPSL